LASAGQGTGRLPGPLREITKGTGSLWGFHRVRRNWGVCGGGELGRWGCLGGSWRADQPRAGKCHHVVAEPGSDLGSSGLLPFCPLTQPRGGFGSPPCSSDGGVCWAGGLLGLWLGFLETNPKPRAWLWLVTTVNICLEGGERGKTLLFRLFVLWRSFFFPPGECDRCRFLGEEREVSAPSSSFPRSRTGLEQLRAPLGAGGGRAGGSGLSRVRGFAAQPVPRWLSGPIAACVTQVPVPTGAALKHSSPPQSSRRSCWVLPTNNCVRADLDLLATEGGFKAREGSRWGVYLRVLLDLVIQTCSRAEWLGLALTWGKTQP